MFTLLKSNTEDVSEVSEMKVLRPRPSTPANAGALPGTIFEFSTHLV